ncbi:diguanylate cyclase [uncultured Thiodictyon sp.]|uniref:sensor domain-containing diguanylate cyclase n=1 Tax=uncultured Thiodictyon sp. TaxID=1846217 RepID=UPI0025FDF731|nr:diguanylate cyclase [uncultured Thiodictyon sp.]
MVLLVQYRVDKADHVSDNGTGWWALGIASLGLGFVFDFIREASSSLGLAAVLLNHLFFVSGMVFLYIGVLRFLGRRERRSPLLGFLLVFVLIVAFFTFLDNSLIAGRVIVSLAVAIVSFVIARALLRYKPRDIETSAVLLAFVFVFNGIVFVLRALTPFLAGPVGDLFTPSLTQTITYLSTLFVTILWTYGFLMLMSQRWHAENREARENLKDIIDFLPDATFAIDREKRVIIWNKAIETMTGIAATQMIGKGGYAYTIPFYGEARQSLTDLVFLDHQEIESRYSHVRRDGRSLSAEAFCSALFNHRGAWIFAKASPLHDASGETIGAIESIRDITPIKRAQAALIESQQHLSDIIENNGALIYVKSPDGRYQLVNRKWEEMTGLIRERVAGKTDEELFPGEIGRNFSEFDRQVLLSGEIMEKEEWLAGARGKHYFISIKFPLRDKDGAITALCGISTDITERKRLEHELQQQATTDELTGITNRRHFLSLADAELKRARRFNHPMTLAMIDLDHFKQINDRYGHPVGDQALLALTRTCRETIREVDIFARFGGDEFVLALTETAAHDGYLVVERIRHAMTARPVELLGVPVAITITAGLASLASDDNALDRLLARADRALYQAKAAGRNRVNVEE